MTAVQSLVVVIIMLLVVLGLMLRSAAKTGSKHLDDLQRFRLTMENSREASNLERQMLNDEWFRLQDSWIKERQQLLDRIQAPSFAEYKQAEVKVIKAQNDVKDPPPLEQL